MGTRNQKKAGCLGNAILIVLVIYFGLYAYFHSQETPDSPFFNPSQTVHMLMQAQKQGTCFQQVMDPLNAYLYKVCDRA